MESRALLPRSRTIDSKPVTITTRPLRLGFIFRNDVSLETLNQVLSYNCSIWGGRYNAFIPTDGSSIRADWWRILTHHDPDYVIYVGEVEDTLVKELYARIQPFWQYAWGDEWLKGFVEGNNRIGAVPQSMLFTYYKAQRLALTSGESACRYPVIAPTRFSTLLELAFGLYPPETRYKELFHSVLAATELECNPNSLAEYLSLVTELNKYTTPLGLTGHRLHTSFDFIGSQPPSLIVATESRIEDICLYQMAQQSAWPFRGKPLLLVPDSEIQSPDDLCQLTQWLQAQTRGNILDIASATLEMNRLRELRAAFRSHLPKWQINLCSCNFDLASPKVYYGERQRLMTIDNGVHTVELPEMDLAYDNSSYVVEIRKHGARQPGVSFSMFAGLNFVLAGSPEGVVFHLMQGGGKRIARGELAIRVTPKDHVVGFRLPTMENLISSVFQDAGLSVIYDEKGKYYEGMLRLAGGEIGDLDFLRRPDILSLLYELMENRALTWNDMLALARPGGRTRAKTLLREAVFSLADKQIFLRGFQLRCPTCDFKTWYELGAMREQVVCQGCRAEFQPNIEHCTFAYRLNQLFVRGFEQGALCALLTLILLDNSSSSELYWKAGCKVRSTSEDIEAELDLVAMCDGGLVIAECKHNLEASLVRDFDNTLRQLRGNVQMAIRARADLFILSTLSNQIPQAVIEAVTSAAEASPQLQVLFLTHEELIRGYLQESTEGQQEREKQISEIYDWLPAHSGECIEFDPDVSSGFIGLG